MSKNDRYIRFSTDLTQNSLLPANENLFNHMKRAPKREYYSSIYFYNQKHFDQFKQSHSVSGIRDVVTNRLVFDFDSNDLHLAKKDTLEVIKRLVESGVSEDSIPIYFSGNKGFHLDIPINQEINQQEFVNIVFGLAADLPTFDVRVNDPARIFRLPLSLNKKSNLYKVPLTLKELSSMNSDEIREYASTIEGFDEKDLKFTSIDLPEILVDLKTTEYKKVASELDFETPIVEGKFEIHDIDFSRCPKWMAKERYALQEGFFFGSESVGQGERNTAFMILAATYRAQGFSADHALNLLVATADKQAKRTGEKPYTEEQLKREVISAVFSPSWQGGVYGKDEKLLVITRQRFNLIESEITNSGLSEEIEDVAEGFKAFAKELNKNRILTGLKSFDDAVVLTKGMVLTVVAAPGGGKSALGNMFAENVSKSGENVLYLSLDLYKNLLFARQLQRHVPYDIKKIFEQFEQSNIDESLLYAYTQVIESYSNVSFVFSSITIEDIEREIQQNTEKKGKSPNLVIVDYLDKVRTPYSDPTQSSAYVVSRLSDFAKKYNTLILLMAQPSKHGSQGPNEPFKSYRSLKGSSSIESDSRVIIGIHREGYSPQDTSRDKFSSLTILKNNTGPLGMFDYAWDGLRGTFTEMTYEQRKELKELREELESINKKDGYDI